MITILKSELKNMLQLNMYSDLHIIKEKIHFFELKYKKAFNDFERSIKQNNEDFETWDDYIEWKAYNESYEISLEDVLTIIERTFDSDQ